MMTGASRKIPQILLLPFDYLVSYKETYTESRQPPGKKCFSVENRAATYQDVPTRKAVSSR